MSIHLLTLCQNTEPFIRTDFYRPAQRGMAQFSDMSAAMAEHNSPLHALDGSAGKVGYGEGRNLFDDLDSDFEENFS